MICISKNTAIDCTMSPSAHLNDRVFPNHLPVNTIQDELLMDKHIRVDMLRLDLLHPQVSGNKWYKLKYNIEAANKLEAKSILSFGGAYSNHLHALAYAGHLLGINTIGMLRGEESSNPTLDDCRRWGMSLHFMSRDQYRHKNETDFLSAMQEKFPEAYIVPEGGNNEAGRKGTREILDGIDLTAYTHIACAVGTGATLAGIANSSLPHQHVLGFSALKNAHYLEETIREYTAAENWTLLHDTHFGGFAKKNTELLEMIVSFKQKHRIELDFIYTAKMVYGLYQMIHSAAIAAGSSVLLIHTGGIQGNRSWQAER
ncbi:MAG: pyridoxal-phosphate dependent enzyme [Chitinophagaceae bacterium]|nr:pyridoxal-phosphate dependent enzyme [Chitinophagaceae bacterium]